MTDTSKPVALITGGSSGIGLELAKLFAEKNYDLIIVADNEIKLQNAATQLRACGSNTQVETVTCDLSKPEGPQTVYNTVQRSGKKIDTLVNNAGVGVFGEFSGNELAAELSMIQLNIVATVQLTKLFLNDMKASGTGKILNTASIAGLTGSPNFAVYGATKAFIYSFTEALRDELKDTDITVTALLPGATDTDFFKRAKMEHTKIANGNLADPKDVAQAGFDALMRNDGHVVAPMMPKIVAAIAKMLPEEVSTKMARVK